MWLCRVRKILHYFSYLDESISCVECSGAEEIQEGINLVSNPRV
jgi:hypothetical protein